MSVLDSKEKLTELYSPPVGEFVVVDVPKLRYIMVDGFGDPNGPLFSDLTRWLFTVVHPLRLHGREVMGKNFVEPPLECLWWADDMQNLIDGHRDKFRWRLMIVADADWITRQLFNTGVRQASQKLGEVPDSLRMASFTEGTCVQTLHVGPPGSQATAVQRLHNEFLPANQFVAHHHHHEIYLGDHHRVAPSKLKTILRQPVRELSKRSLLDRS
ncbi:MAG: hypothetical protein E6R00_06475 [Gammaproteobacteria bacterium]|jgi:hypothetical protein|nr:MAG: hypothetical protein E6R00_06475 [Gammaproteobacteria bacterium]